MNNHISKYTKEYYESIKKDKLPFDLRPYHKTNSLSNWNKIGIIFMGLEDQIYDIYIHSSHCDRCKKKFKDSLDRCLDHDHDITDDFNVRGIVCRNCNSINQQIWNNNTGEPYICKAKDKNYAQRFSYQITIIRDGKYVLSKKRKTLEEAIELRNKFIAENPHYFQ